VMAGWHEYLAKDYWEVKKNIASSALDDPYLFFDTILKSNEIYNFLDSFSLDKEDKWDAFLLTDAMIEYTVMLLDKHGDYRYDMEEKDKEITAYIEARLLQKRDTIQEDFYNEK
jgi:hypothetical protein